MSISSSIGRRDDMAGSGATDRQGLDRDIVEATRQEFAHRGMEAHLQVTVALEVERISKLIQATAAAQPELTNMNLGLAGWQALTALSFHPQKRMPMTKLALRVGTHPTSITRTIDRLERLGYVSRVRMPEDRRVTKVVILPAGEKAQALVAAALDECRWGMAEVPEELLEELSSGLAVLREKLQGSLSISDTADPTAT
ncbi:hypothetical protein CQ020_14425 [Arthrobacter sp. MYb23]|uniref:MarR family transcriptional regulator n=1 Tax=unclassified Arthrobacter TaxID=235627 RepID=UPI000CFDCD6D|nr:MULTISPECIES: MarR family transcriptional regulator [unclassified Arthrobacter]PRB41090.1 hypothetical protein CQ038_14940 [Arthrobacter sp. MYb51]PRB94760.1 hypothetical protein CQ020_14425 [Arthrobacter sp. MYb23]